MPVYNLILDKATPEAQLTELAHHADSLQYAQAINISILNPTEKTAPNKPSANKIADNVVLKVFEYLEKNKSLQRLTLQSPYYISLTEKMLSSLNWAALKALRIDAHVVKDYMVLQACQKKGTFLQSLALEKIWLADQKGLFFKEFIKALQAMGHLESLTLSTPSLRGAQIEQLFQNIAGRKSLQQLKMTCRVDGCYESVANALSKSRVANVEVDFCHATDEFSNALYRMLINRREPMALSFSASQKISDYSLLIFQSLMRKNPNIQIKIADILNRLQSYQCLLNSLINIKAENQALQDGNGNIYNRVDQIITTEQPHHSELLRCGIAGYLEKQRVMPLVHLCALKVANFIEAEKKVGQDQVHDTSNGSEDDSDCDVLESVPDVIRDTISHYSTTLK